MNFPMYERPHILNRIDLSYHHLIEASAGTGKTYTIEHLVIELLFRGVKLRDILLVTFTEKAAQELKDRIRAKLQELIQLPADAGANLDPKKCWVLGPEQIHRLEDALFDFDDASIDTIHGYCNRVLREFAFENRQFFDLVQMNPNQFFDEIFYQHLRESTLSRDSLARTLLIEYLKENPDGLRPQRVGSRKRTLSATAWQLLDKKGILKPDPEEAEKFWSTWHQWFLTHDQEALQADIECLNINARVRKSILAFHEQMCRALRKPDLHWARIMSWFKSDSEANLKSLRKMITPQGYFNDKPKKDKVNAGDELPEHLTEFIEKSNPLPGVTYSIEAVLMVTLLPGLREAMEERKRKRGWFDFDDMIKLVANGLRDTETGPILVRALRGKHRFALIDEFQDTDGDQWSIFSTLFLGSLEHRLFLIGDPKQAIYKFRGADINVYLKARTILQNLGGHVIPLEFNHRSSAEMVEAVNALFTHPSLFSAEIKYKRVGCGKPEGLEGLERAPLTCWSLSHEDENKKVSVGKASYIFAQNITEEIDKLLKMGLKLPDGSPLRPRHIAILTRKRSEATLMGTVLGEQGIPYAFYKQNGLFRTKEARDFYDLLYAIEHPRDDASCFRAMLSSFYPVELNELVTWREVPEEVREQFLSWQRFIYRTHDYRALFNDIFERTRILERLLFLEDAEREATNYEHVADVLKREGTQVDLKQLLRLLSNYMEGKSGLDEDLLRLETEKEAVQIMTIHAAKGLEFPVVFLFGGYGSNPSGQLYHEFYDPEHGRVIDLGKKHPDYHELELIEESERLFYVAFTRAKYLLYHTWIPSQQTELKTEQTVLHESLIALRESGECGHLHFEDQIIEHHYPEVLEGKVDPSDLEAWEPASQQEQELFKQIKILLEQRNFYHMSSYTRMAHHNTNTSGLASQSPERIYNFDESPETSLQDEDPLPKGKDTGICLHNILEDTAKLKVAEYMSEGFEAWRKDDRVRMVMERHLKDADLGGYLETVAAMMWRVLTYDLGEGLTVAGLNEKDRLHEVDFYYPIAKEGGEVMFHGSIDLVFRVGERSYFADWKSDTLPDYSEEFIGRKIGNDYMDQVRIYLLAMMRWLKIKDEEDYEQRFGGFYYFFLRGYTLGGGIYFYRPNWDEVREYERYLLANA